jgi:hypothetical protein
MCIREPGGVILPEKNIRNENLPSPVSLVTKEKGRVRQDSTSSQTKCPQVDSISHHIASGQPLEVTQTIAPHPVTEIQPILDAENITLQWPRPDGRIGKEYLTQRLDKLIFFLQQIFGEKRWGEIFLIHLCTISTFSCFMRR